MVRVPAPFHLLEVVAALHVPHEEQAFQGFHVRSGGDHVDGNGNARMVVVAELGERTFRIFVVVGDLFAEMVFFAEFLPDDLDDVVGMAVGLGKDEGLGHFKFALFVLSVGKDFGQMLLECANDRANLVGIDHIVIELLLGIDHVLIQLFASVFLRDEFFPVVHILRLSR